MNFVIIGLGNFGASLAKRLTALGHDVIGVDKEISKVEFFVDGTKAGEDVSSPWQLTWPATAGTHEITARATDNKGGQKTSAPVSVTATVANPLPPSVSITTPVNNAAFTTGDVVSIKASASDADGTVVKVEFFVNGTLIGEDVSSPYEINWNALTGAAVITAKATDNNNLNTTSATVTVNVTQGSSGPPVVSITSPAPGAHLTTNSQVLIEATASDEGGSIAKVEFLVNGTKVGEDAAAPYQLTWTAQSGTKNILARATDNAGNQANSPIITVLVTAGTSPTVRITSPVSGTTVPEGSVVGISADASDADGSITKVEFYVNGTKIGEDDTTPFSYDWTSIAGAAAISAKATDNAGIVTSSTTVSITVTGETVEKDTVVFDFSKAVISGTNYRLPVSVISAKNVTEFHFSMNINTSKILFDQIINHTSYLVNSSNFDLFANMDFSKISLVKSE
jgi:chitodextrinase